MVQPILKKVYSFGNCASRASFPLQWTIRYFCSLTPKMGLKWTCRRLRVTQMTDCDFLVIYFYVLHKWLVTYCCRGHLTHASRCTEIHERFRNDWQQVLYTIVAIGWVTSRFALAHQLVGLLVILLYVESASVTNAIKATPKEQAQRCWWIRNLTPWFRSVTCRWTLSAKR